MPFNSQYYLPLILNLGLIRLQGGELSENDVFPLLLFQIPPIKYRVLCRMLQNLFQVFHWICACHISILILPLHQKGMIRTLQTAHLHLIYFYEYINKEQFSNLLANMYCKNFKKELSNRNFL